MFSLARSAQWLFHEFGFSSVRQAGSDAWLIILARSCRMFSFGAVSLIIALFMSSLGFSDPLIGLFMTFTLAGDVVLSLLLALVADRLGRRRVFLLGGALMALSGAVFAGSETYWCLLLAAVVGVMSATGGDFGPFCSIEESTLSHLSTPMTRADILSWYVTASILGSAAGTGVSGKLVAYFVKKASNHVKAYHLMFWTYVAMGALTIVVSFLMSPQCEIAKPVKGEETEPLLDEEEASVVVEAVKVPWWRRLLPSSHLASRPMIAKLWILLTIDSLADGMFGRHHGHQPATHGPIYCLRGPAGPTPQPRHTMVFTHLPSSAAVLFFPAPQTATLAIALLFVNTGLNSMDQGPRGALIAAIVKPEERTAVMGITSTRRTLASTIGPSLTGFLAGSDKFWIAYVVARLLRIGYDLGLFFIFVGVDLESFEQSE